MLLLEAIRPGIIEALPLVPTLVLEGQWWRLISFFFLPPSLNPIWCFLTWMMLFFVGNALEGHWGTVRLNGYLLVGWVLAAAAAFLLPVHFVFAHYVIFSLFLAFAFLAPELEMMVFFVLPVKVKWLALAQWLWYGLDLIRGPLEVRVSVAAAVLTFMAFFWGDIVQRVRGQGRRLAHAQTMRAAEDSAPRHTCRVCGKNSETHRELDFRYCSKCEGEACYCSEHIRNHEHIGLARLAKGEK